MSRRKNKAKKSKSKMRRKKPPAGRADGIGKAIPPLRRDELLESGVPPELVEMVMIAQQAALDGDTSLMEETMELLDAIAGEPFDEASSPEDAFPLSSFEAAEALYAAECEDGTESGFEAAAKQALKIDPKSVEAHVMLGDFADTEEDRVQWYRRACEAAKSKPSHLVRAAMPIMRARMGGRLLDDSRLSDAADVLFPGLDEDPSDPIGLRFLLLDLCFRLRWYEELGTLLDRFSKDNLAPMLFARPIYLFQSEGDSSKARELLKAAHQAKPNVARFLAGLELPPALGTEYPVVADEEDEAAMTAGYLLPGIRTVEGTTRWIRETLDLKFSHPGSSSSETDGDQGGVGDLDQALELPQGQMTWQYHLHRCQDGAYLGVLLEDLSPISTVRFANRPKAKELRDFLLDSVCDPMVGPPRKPAVLQVPTKADLKALAKTVGTYGVACEHQALEADAKAMLAESLDALARRLERLASDRSDEADEIDVADLPQSDQQWWVGVFQPPMWILDRATPYRAYMQLVLDASSGCIVGTEGTADMPSPEQQWQVLVETMAEPMVGQPRRPESIVLDPRMSAEPLTRYSGSFNVFTGDQQVADSFDKLIAGLLLNSGQGETPLAETEGVTEKLMERYYDAAARFYKAAPWKMVGGDNLIRLEYRESGESSWGITVMGQLGQVLGLSLIENVKHARKFIQQKCPMEELVAISVQFGEAFDMVPIDFWHLEQNHWSVADAEAYPLVFKIDHGKHSSDLSNEDLRMVESVMSVLPRFLDQPRDQTMDAKDSLGREFRLSWEL
ncbi:hypothetical protein [Novipirellula caenicola]|uniref:Suppressor of fused protein (SUFU) n=1 Tax=Novipirellula caenicola TaxID=1536901 RepID=A0ABP9VWT2_9BACT